MHALRVCVAAGTVGTFSIFYRGNQIKKVRAEEAKRTVLKEHPKEDIKIQGLARPSSDVLGGTGERSWHMAHAALVGFCSKDPNTQVGAIIVTKEGVVIGVGYNGRPVPGVSNEDFPWGKESKDELENKTMMVVHAEANAINGVSDKKDLEGSCIYVTLHPCNECAKDIIANKIKTVVYLNDPPITESGKVASSFLVGQKLLRDANIDVEKFEPSKLPDLVGKVKRKFDDILTTEKYNGSLNNMGNGKA